MTWDLDTGKPTSVSIHAMLRQLEDHDEVSSLCISIYVRTLA